MMMCARYCVMVGVVPLQRFFQLLVSVLQLVVLLTGLPTQVLRVRCVVRVRCYFRMVLRTVPAALASLAHSRDTVFLTGLVAAHLH